jgi:hypothetical protein
VKEALPEIGYTKAREIAQVAWPRTEAQWVEAARSSTQAQLVQKVKRVRARAASRPAAALFAPPADEPALAAEVPVRVSVEFTPEQHARGEALGERVRKRGAAGDRAEALLEALLCLSSSDSKTTNNADNFPWGKSDQNIHIHVHQCPDCGQVEANGRALGRADAARVGCDAVVSTPGQRATATIAPRIRREVLARDRHRCQAPGCGRRHFLEIHHKQPRARGGTHEPANLVTLCAPCHRLWHERC